MTLSAVGLIATSSDAIGFPVPGHSDHPGTPGHWQPRVGCTPLVVRRARACHELVLRTYGPTIGILPNQVGDIQRSWVRWSRGIHPS